METMFVRLDCAPHRRNDLRRARSTLHRIVLALRSKSLRAVVGFFAAVRRP